MESRAALAILAWSVVLLGLVFGQFPRSAPPGAALLTGLLLAVVAALSGLSVLWGADDGAALHEFVRVSAYLGVFVLIVCASREGESRAWLTGLAIGIVAVGVLALLSRLIPALPGGDEEITEFLPAAQGRLSYPIGYWNALAALLALGSCLLVWLGACGRTLLGRAAAVAGIPLLCMGIYLASSRGAFLVLLVGVAVLIALGPRRPSLIGSAALGALGAALAVVLASGQGDLLDAETGSEATSEGLDVLAATISCVLFTGVMRVVFDRPLESIRVPSSVTRGAVAVGAVAVLIALVVANPAERFEDFKELPEAPSGQADFTATHLESGSGSGRWQFWGEALDAFGSEPLHGVGAGGYGAYWSQNAPIDQVVTQAHSLYLEQLAELGPLALLALLGVLLVGPIRGLRARDDFPGGETAVAVALVAAGATSAGLDWTWEVPAAFGPVLLALALLSGPALSPPGHGTRLRAGGPGRFGWGVAVLVLGWITLILAAGSLLAERSLDSSREAAGDGDLTQANEDARDAIALEPWAAEPRLQLALVQEASGELDAADASVSEAISRSEDDWRLWLVKARIATLDSRVADARDAFQRAEELNPRAPVFTGLDGPLSP